MISLQNIREKNALKILSQLQINHNQYYFIGHKIKITSIKPVNTITILITIYKNIRTLTASYKKIGD